MTSSSSLSVFGVGRSALRREGVKAQPPNAEHPTPASTALAGFVSGRCRGEGRRGEVNAEALAPDGHRLKFAQVHVGGQVIVLVADVALEWSNVNEAGPLDGPVVSGVGSGDKVDMDRRAVRGLELGETEHALAIGQFMDGCHA